MAQTLLIGTQYNLTFYAPAVLGTGLSKAKLCACLDYSMARMIADVSQIHASIYSSLPANTPRSPEALIYYKFTTTTGEDRVIAQDWISGTPEVATTTTLDVTFEEIGTSDIARLRQLLAANGFKFVIG